MSAAKERWLPVPGYESDYIVSSFGNVAPISGRRGSRPFKPLSQSLCGSGYLKVTLRKNGNGANVMIHRIVALAFVPNPEHKPQINHKNGNKLDNRAENLEWVTRSENQLHAYRVLGRARSHKGHPVKISADDAREIFRSQLSTKELSDIYGISDTMVRNIKQGKSWKEATCQLITVP